MGVKLPFPQEPKKLLSAPYHGLFKGHYTGKLKLTNGNEIDWPGPGGGSTVLLKVPGQPAVTRTPAEAAADAAAGVEYRNYALLSGGQYGKTAPIASPATDAIAATWVYIDPSKARWLIRLKCNIYGGAGAYLVQVRRYLHIDGTTADWSAEKPVTLSPQYWPYRFCETMCQNSTGAEVVIHSGTQFALPDAIMKVTVSGTVDPAAADLGLGFGFENIEWPGRVCGSRSGGFTVTGKLRERIDYQYKEVINSVETGRTLSAYVQYDDKVLVHDDRPAPGSNWVNTYDSGPTFTSDKVFVRSQTIARSRYVWGAYHADVLKLVRADYLYTNNTNCSSYSYHPDNGYNPDRWDGTQTLSNGMILFYGETKINEQRQDQTVAFWETGFYVDGYSEIDPGVNYTSSVFRLDDGAQPLTAGSPDRIWYEPERISNAADRIGNAVVKVVEKKYYSATNTTVTTCQALHAPDGNTIPYVLAQGVGSQVQASWHPVTGLIEASQDPVICWF